MDDPFASSSGGVATREKIKNARELENLRIQIQREGEQNREYNFTDFIDAENRSRIPVASDFNYDRFRNRLYEDLQILANAKLYPPQDSGVVTVDNISSCIIALTQIQGSRSINIPSLPGPTLVLNPNQVARPPTPAEGSKPKAVPATPTPKGGKKQPVTPENPKNQQGTTAGPKTQDSPGNESDDEPDFPDDKLDDGQDVPTGNNNAVIRNFSYPWGSVEDSLWARVCLFFNCELDAPTIRVEGIQVDIEPYQALAIYQAIFRGQRRHSYIIGDDVGLGKTGMALCIATIWFIMLQTHREVEAERGAPPSTGAKHLRDDEEEERKECPTQKGRIQCSCLGSSQVSNLLLNIQDFPTFIITPPGLIPTFIGEANKWIDFSPDSPASPITIHIAHSSFKRSGKFFSDEKVRLVDEASATIPNTDRPQNPGGSRHIVIVSSSGMNSFMHNVGPRVVAKFRAGLILFDEFHAYAGGRAVTMPFKFLEAQCAKSETWPPIAIGLSGSSRSNCAYWRPFIRYAFEAHAKRVGLQSSAAKTEYAIAKLTNIDEFNKYEAYWDNLVNSLNDTTLKGDQLRARDQRMDELYQFLRLFIPLMMISRERGDLFRGVQILARSQTQLIRCDTIGVAAQPFFDLISQVESLINKEYKLALGTWKESGQQGEKPVKRAIAQRNLELLSDSPRSSFRASQILLRASTFPAVAQLVNDKVVSYEDTLGTKVLPIATKISTILRPKDFDDETKLEALRALESSPWWEHRNTLFESSRKIREVVHQIDNLIEISTKAVDDPSLAELGPPPSDKTTIRHLLLYADYPLSAFLMLMVLLPRYTNKNVEFMYAHSGVNVNTRQEYVDYIQQDCMEGGPIKILISTISIIGQGFNIFRAGTVIITEIPRSSDKQKQAFGRIDRRGQVMNPSLIQLYDTVNLPEQIRRIRNENRDQLTGTGATYPLAELLFGLEDNGDPDDQQDGGQGSGSKGTGTNDAGTSSNQADNGKGKGKQIEVNQTGVGRITSYRDEEAEAAAREAFPNERFRRIYTSGYGLLCGRNAIVGSFRTQLSARGIPVPAPEDLLTDIYRSMVHFGYTEFQNFAADQLSYALWDRGRLQDPPIDLRLGLILNNGQNDENEAVLMRQAEPVDGEQFTVWIYLRSNGDVGHYETIESID
ncbi:hypothetical protein F4803DRAFT_575256 [Xylaria telfairii]|nr:hypothetical protein F4803DRAFT_575256 [Xylaria telfairii]